MSFSPTITNIIVAYMCRPLTKNNIQVNLGKYSLNISISIGIIFYNKDNLTKTLQI